MTSQDVTDEVCVHLHLYLQMVDAPISNGFDASKPALHGPDVTINFEMSEGSPKRKGEMKERAPTISSAPRKIPQ